MTESILCNHCGAPLRVLPEVKFCTCAHCGSTLRIRRSDQVVFSEVVRVLRAQHERIDQHLEALRIQGEIESLDREWAERYPKAEPLSAGPVLPHHPLPGLIFIALFTAFALAFSIAGASSGAGFVFVPGGLLLAGLGIHNYFQADKKRKQEAADRREMYHRKQALQRALEAADQAA